MNFKKVCKMKIFEVTSVNLPNQNPLEENEWTR